MGQHYFAPTLRLGQHYFGARIGNPQGLATGLGALGCTLLLRLTVPLLHHRYLVPTLLRADTAFVPTLLSCQHCFMPTLRLLSLIHI